MKARQKRIALIVGGLASLADRDRRLARFLERHDADIAPERDDLDAQRIADARRLWDSGRVMTWHL